VQIVSSSCPPFLFVLFSFRGQRAVRSAAFPFFRPLPGKSAFFFRSYYIRFFRFVPTLFPTLLKNFSVFLKKFHFFSLFAHTADFSGLARPFFVSTARGHKLLSDLIRMKSNVFHLFLNLLCGVPFLPMAPLLLYDEKKQTPTLL